MIDFKYEILLTVAKLEPDAYLKNIHSHMLSDWSLTKLGRDLAYYACSYQGNKWKILNKQGRFYSLTETGKEQLKCFFKEIEDWRLLYESKYGELPRNKPTGRSEFQDSPDWEGLQDSQ